MSYAKLFLSLLASALQRVPDVYYKAPSANREAVREVLDPNDPDYPRFAEGSFIFGERAFCYELYHQLRCLLDQAQANVQDWDARLVLQGEVRKPHLLAATEEHFRVNNLDRNFMPDFLLHVPGDFDAQEVMMEVKTDPDLTYSGFQDDLAKLQQFIARYKYKTGVFLTVNTDPPSMLRILRQARCRDWIRTALPDRRKIVFVCIPAPDVQPTIWCLGDLIGEEAGSAAKSLG
jgi:hypothetical protein